MRRKWCWCCCSGLVNHIPRVWLIIQPASGCMYIIFTIRLRAYLYRSWLLGYISLLIHGLLFSLTKFFEARTLISYKLTIHFSSFSSINIEQLTTFYYTLRLFSKIIVCSGWWTSPSLTKYYRAKCFFVFHQPSNRDLTDSISLMSVQIGVVCPNMV